jgi:hypothetical protein
MNENKKIRIKYFWVAVIGAGSAGIWLPLLIASFKGISNYKFTEIPPNLTTYFLGILMAGCIDQGLKIFEDEANRSKSEFLNIIIVLCLTFLLLLLSVLGSIFEYHFVASIASIIGVIFAIKVWWNVNINITEDNSTSILGGKV